MKLETSYGRAGSVVDAHWVVLKRAVIFLPPAVFLFSIAVMSSPLIFPFLCLGFPWLLIPLVLWLYLVFRPLPGSSNLLLLERGLLVSRKLAPYMEQGQLFIPHSSVERVSLDNYEGERYFEILYTPAVGPPARTLRISKRAVADVDRFRELLAGKVKSVSWTKQTRGKGLYFPYFRLAGFRGSAWGFLVVILVGLLMVPLAAIPLFQVNHPDYADGKRLLYHTGDFNPGAVLLVREKVVDARLDHSHGMVPTNYYSYTTESGFGFTTSSGGGGPPSFAAGDIVILEVQVDASGQSGRILNEWKEWDYLLTYNGNDVVLTAVGVLSQAVLIILYLAWSERKMKALDAGAVPS